MPFFYSAAERAFYHDAIHDETARPADAVAVSNEEHAALFAAQAAGQDIAPDANGRPVAIDQPAPDAEAVMQMLRRKRDRLLRESDWTQVADSPLNAAARIEWADYRHRLRNLPSVFDGTGHISWPSPPPGN